MTERVHFHCENCGFEFEEEVLTKSELEQYRRQRRPWGAVQCPRCNRTSVRREGVGFRRAS
jgi:transposase-like protein